MNVYSANLPALEIVERTDPGRDPDKQVNEDSCGHRLTKFGQLVVVCDGMGGHVGGEEASRAAVAAIFETFETASPEHAPRNVLRGAIELANERVYDLAPPDATARPGSTVVAILVHEGGVEVAHVGDSRCYRMHAGEVAQLTKDHSLVQGLVDAGLVKPEDAADHPSAHRITRALGTQADVDVELAPEPLPLAPGDAFVLCSDGLSDLVQPKDIAEALAKPPRAEAAARLVDLANARGGHDNITAVVLRVSEPPPPQVAAPPPKDAPKAAPEPRRARVETAEDRERKRKLILAGAIAAPALIVLATLGTLRSRASTAEAHLAPAVAPFVDAGFARESAGFFSSAQALDLDLPEATCALAVASPGAGPLHLERPGGSDTAKGSLLHCACSPEHVAVRVDPSPSGERASVALLRVDAKSIAGRYAFMQPRPATVGPGGEACVADALEAYVANVHPKAPPSDAWGATPAGKALSARGFAAIARVPADGLAVLEPATAQCFVATGGGATVMLHVMGAVVARAPNVAWCATKIGAQLVERDGAGTIDVAAAPLARTGGLLGLRDALAAASIDALVWSPSTDHAALAAEALRASVVPDVVTVADGSILEGDSAIARVVSLSVGGDAAFAPDPGSKAFFLCAPPLAAGARQNLCVQAGPRGWRPPPPPVDGGAAYGALPMWMSAWAKSNEPALAQLQLAVLGLARRLNALGYEPTVIEGVKEEYDGVSIVARSGDDSAVAVGLWPAPPWVDPYGDPAWTLDGEPRFIDLTKGERVHLSAHAQTAAPLGARRTVVFRHATKR